MMAADDSKKIGNFQFTVIFSKYNELISKGSLSTKYSERIFLMLIGCLESSSIVEHLRLKGNIHVRFVIHLVIQLQDSLLIQIFDF